MSVVINGQPQEDEIEWHIENIIGMGICQMDIKKIDFSGSYALGTRIRAARKSTGLKQAEFGELLGASQSAISNWENNTGRPGLGVIRQLAEMTKDWDFVTTFLDESGIPQTMVGQAKSYSTSNKQVATKEIIQLRDPNAIGTPRVLDISEVEGVFQLPSAWFPIQTKIYAIVIDDGSMDPVIASGSLVFVDAHQRDPEMLVDKLVVVRIGNGVAARFLRKHRQFFLVPYSVTNMNPVLPLESGSDQTIIGEVVLWVTSPQKRPFDDLRPALRVEIEQMINRLLGKKPVVSEPLDKSIPRLVKKKQIDPTLGQLLLKVSEIVDKGAHGDGITPNDVEQLTHFMPIIRSALKEAAQVQR